jgi:hypothetical protein
VERTQQMLHMEKEITISGIDVWDTLVLYSDQEGDRKIITFSARDKATGKEEVSMFYREWWQIYFKTGYAESQYNPISRAEMKKICEGYATFLGQ